MKTVCLQLSDIVTTAGTQVRSCIDNDTVDQYAEAMLDTANEFPPVAVFHDGSRYILADGFHRVMAATRNGFKDIRADIHKGTKTDALAFALSANAKHGLRRTNADKRRSVVLARQEWPGKSDRFYAELCAVHHDTVATVRRDEKQVAESATSQKRTGLDGKSYTVKPKSRPDTAPEQEEKIIPITEDSKWKAALPNITAQDIEPKKLDAKIYTQEFDSFLETIKKTSYDHKTNEWIFNHMDASLRHFKKWMNENPETKTKAA